MAKSGPGELIEIEERLNSEQYVQIMDQVLLPTVRAMLIPEPEPVYLVMDNCPIHNSKLVTDWLNNHPEIIRIEWPAKSPDLNPIENLWAKMVSHWDASNAKNKTSLIEHAKSVWELCRPTRSENYCENLF